MLHLYHNKKEQLIKAINSFLNTSLEVKLYLVDNSSNDDLKELSKGFKKAAQEFGIQIIGGDTISNEKLDISITIISKTSNPVLRSGVKKNDLLCYTGILGSCKEDLQKLFENKEISKKSKFIKPKLKPYFFYEIAPYITASMDISDGLFFELEKLSKASSVGFEFFNEIDESIGSSGEEYEILFSFDEKNLEKINKIAKKHKPKVLFLENVKNLVSHDKGNTFKVIKDILENKLGYRVYTKVLNSMTHANIPQNRERIFIVAFDPNQVPNHNNFVFPSEIPLTKTIHDILEKGKLINKKFLFFLYIVLKKL